MNIIVKKSITLSALVLGAHLGAVLFALLLPLPAALRLGLAALIVLHGWSLRRHPGLAPPAALQLDDQGECRLALAPDPEPQRYRVTAASCVPGGVRLVLARPGRRAMLLVLRDALEADDYRALRARIRQQRLPRPIAQPPA